MTYKDYKNLPEGSRIELHEGKFYNMANATRKHQDIQGEIFSQFREYLKGKSCKVQTQRGVRLFAEEDESDTTTYIPDIFVLCDQSKDMETYIKGAPDLVIEIWSPSTGSVDLIEKRDAYEKAGVKEYWVVRNIGKIYQYLPDECGIYHETPYVSLKGEDIEIPVKIWDGRFSIKLGQFVHEIGKENP